MKDNILVAIVLVAASVLTYNGLSAAPPPVSGPRPLNADVKPLNAYAGPQCYQLTELPWIGGREAQAGPMSCLACNQSIATASINSCDAEHNCVSVPVKRRCVPVNNLPASQTEEP